MNALKKINASLFKQSILKRRTFFLAADIVFIVFSMYSSFWLRYNGALPQESIKPILYYTLLALFTKLTFLIIFNLYDISWEYFGLAELVKMLKALAAGSLLLGVLIFLIRVYPPFAGLPFPRSTLILDFIMCSFLIGTLRISKRVFKEGTKGTFQNNKAKINVLVYGAGGAGEQIVRDMQRNKFSLYQPVGFIDDDPAKLGISIHGVKVLGNRDDVKKIVSVQNIDEVLIALSSVPSRVIKQIVNKIGEAEFIRKIKILPGVNDLLDGKVTLSDIQDVKLEDLLGRDPVSIDFDLIKEFIQNKRVLITGAGGSIGSELTKSILKFNPHRVIILDIDETEIFNLLNDTKLSAVEIIPVIGDIKDQIKMDSVFEEFRPQIVLHSAAYKHVPIIELYPEEGVKTNILGTKILAELSMKNHVERFIFISTDKAINPSSVMGATKRVSENLLKIFNEKNKTKFISVRFGNVLGSRGSVIPLFKDQLKKGGPITVTHPEMKRYFMSTSEAVLLVLEASAAGEGGEVFVLDMGEPIKIVDLAKELIQLSGFEPEKDIPIVFTNIRPGEKLFEELLGAEEGSEPTDFEKIFVAKSSNNKNADALLDKIDRLIEISLEKNKNGLIIELLQDIVPKYSPSKARYPYDYF